MGNRTESLPGLRPTTRQFLIFAVFGLTVLAALGSLMIPKGGTSYHLMPWVLVLSPWLLGLMFMLFDQPGPVRNWLAPLLISLFYPSLALWHDAMALMDWAVRHQAPSWNFTILFNMVLIGGFTYYIVCIYPRRCPNCSARGLIPIQRVLREDPRTSKTRWCASCGKKYWSDPQGQWQVERRKTWLDVPADAAHTDPVSPEGAHPEAAGSLSTTA